jgi:hypothetical protein
LDEALIELGIELIAPHRRGRRRPKTQDGRPLRRYKRRYKVEIVHPQLTKSNGWTVAGGREDVADLDVAVGDHDAVNQQFDEGAALRNGCRVQTVADLGTKRLQRLGDRTQGEVLLRHGVELPLLALQGLLPTRELVTLALKDRQGEHASELGIEQALLSGVQLHQGLAQRRLACLQFLGQPVPPMCAA